MESELSMVGYIGKGQTHWIKILNNLQQTDSVYLDPVWEKRCFQNKSKFSTEEYFSKHINIKTKWKYKLITKAINLIKLGSLGGESCWSN